ncbi:uncharacterized protein [Aegilops tauschii subsp. strangulata]|uniref:uncharacterized protein n=1 Tax=Aegilops tauschii subsp. strangulata TaxID=200361 RepID=UPI00098A82C2|nr:uncharacterized protein LOC109743463 [Aegilops tauschii subsp. strangulata]
MASQQEGDGRATRVQAVSAYMWKTLASVVGAADTRCRMGWWVDGRRRLTAPEHRALATSSYVGNVSIFVLGEDSVEEIQRKPLPEVASMVRELINARAYDDRFQEMVDWVEHHKSGATYMDASNIGLGYPTMVVTAFTSFPMDTDLGFGHAANGDDDNARQGAMLGVRTDGGYALLSQPWSSVNMQLHACSTSGSQEVVVTSSFLVVRLDGARNLPKGFPCSIW